MKSRKIKSHSIKNHKIRKRIMKLLPYGMKNKLFFVNISFGAFLMLSLITAVTFIYSRFLYDGTKNLLQNQTQQVLNIFDQHMDSLEKIVMTAENQSSFRQLVSGNNTGYQAYIVSRDSYNYLKTVHEFYRWASLYAFALSDNYVMGSRIGNISSNFSIENSKNTGWYREARDSASNISIISDFVPPVTGGKSEFAYILTMRDLYSWNIKGFIAASLDKAVLDDILKNTNLQSMGFMVILDDKGRIAYSSNERLSEENAGIIPGVEYFAGRPDVVSDDSFCDYYMVSMKSSVQGWRFISFVGKEYLNRQVLELQITVVILVLAALLLLMIGGRFVAAMITRPIKKLIAFIHQVEKTEFSRRLDLQTNDEVEEVVTSFNMLIDSVRENQILRRKAQMDALQKQIDPHFLFNTLESVKALAIRKETDFVCETVDRLADMFRYNTNRENKSTTSISEEINHISDYLHIQKVRFGDRLNFKIEIEQSILQNITLKFILQPIVENSLRHALEKMDRDYLLTVKGYERDEGYIIFEIKDNGPGIAPDRLEKIREYIYDRAGTVSNDGMGIGLKNIQERVSLFYSEKSGITIDSEINKYTIVMIIIPKL